MANAVPEKYRLIKEETGSRSSTEDTIDGLQGHEYLQREDPRYFKLSKRTAWIGGAVLICALISNIVLTALSWRHIFATEDDQHHHHYHEVPQSTDKGASYLGFPYDHPLIWKDHTVYADDNVTAADIEWINMEIDYVTITLSKEESEEMNLPPAFPIPWDENYSIYALSPVHGLHCLKSMHRSNLEYRMGIPQSYPAEHILHCFDNIRQDLTCAFDDMPRAVPFNAPSSHTSHTGVGQYRTCKDWSKLEKFAKDHPGCLSYNELKRHEMDGTDPFPDAISYCPEDSHFLPAIRKYYNKPDDWVPEKPRPPYPDVPGVPWEGYGNQRSAVAGME